MRLKADLTLLLVSIVWGSAFVAQRIAGQLGSVYLFNEVRYLMAALVVLPFAFRVSRNDPPQFGGVAKPTYNSEQFKWMFVAGLVLFVGSTLQQAGMLYTTAGNAGFITALYVVLVPFALFAIWREKPHWLSVVAVVLAGVGAFFLSTGGRFEVRAGDVLELASAFFWTFHVIILGKQASRYESLSFSVGQLVVCGILNLGLGIVVERSIPFSQSLLGAIA